jgi:hypothetical protein
MSGDGNSSLESIGMNKKTPLLVLASLWIATTSHATLTLFAGADPGVGPGGARPTSDAAAASFDLAVGSFDVIDFEGLTSGNFGMLTVFPGVDVTLTGTDNDADPGISTDNDTILGYNTTSGGSQHLRVVPIFDIGTASALFDFGDPINAFGTYLTGLGTANGNLHVLFDDGSMQDLSVAGSTLGGVQFFGFTSDGAPIASVTFQLQNVTAGTRDIFGIDDVRFSTAAPEPGTIALLGVALLALAGATRRRL